MVLVNNLDYYLNLSATQYTDRTNRLEYRTVPGLIAGVNHNISNSGDEDVWDGPGLWTPPTEARIHDVVSDNTNDTLLGSGARTLFVTGLDASLLPQEETVEMDGTTVVPTSLSYLRINDAFVIGAGASDTNEGIITLTAQVDVTVTAFLEAGTSETQAVVYTVGADRLLLLTSLEIQMFLAMGSPNADISAAIRTRRIIDAPDAALRTSIPIHLNRDTQPLYSRDFNVFISIPEKTDIIGHVLESSSNNMEVAMAIGFLLIDTSEN